MTSRPSKISASNAPAQRLSPKGRETLDPLPKAPNVSNRRVMSERDRIQGIIRGERLKEEMRNAGKETFEEADDFDVGDDFDPTSPYEEIFDPGLAEESRAKPMPVKPTGKASSGDQVDEPHSGDVAERLNQVVVDDKTYTGKQLRDLVSFLRSAPSELIGKMLPEAKK